MVNGATGLSCPPRRLLSLGFGLLRRLVSLRPLQPLGHQARPKRLRRRPHPLRLAVDHDANLLQVRLELTGRAPGDLDTDPAKILGLAAVSALTANLGTTAGISAFKWHEKTPVEKRATHCTESRDRCKPWRKTDLKRSLRRPLPALFAD